VPGIRLSKGAALAESFTMRRVDVLLVGVVKQLGVEYPELDYGVISGCVEAVHHARIPRPDEDVIAAVGQIEVAARADIDRLVAGLAVAQADA
jgi:hypothetical protein